MTAPSSVDEKADIYTKAQMIVTYRNGKSKTITLKYHMLMGTTDEINGKVVGGLFDVYNLPSQTTADRWPLIRQMATP